MKDLKIKDKVLQFEMPTKPLLSFQKGGLPSYFIIGAQKAGTTSVQLDLVSHPSVRQPKMKEIFYFSHGNASHDLNYYKSFFPKLKPGEVTGDATANYLESTRAPEKLKRMVPNAKIICLLRNPVDRAYSHYLMAKKLGFETESFENALSLEEDRIKYGEHLNPNIVLQRMGYREKGKYINDVKRWKSSFDDHQILFIKSESYFSSPAEEYAKICDFLELPKYQPSEFHWAKQKEQNAELRQDLRNTLSDFYEPYNAELKDFLGEEFSW